MKYFITSILFLFIETSVCFSQPDRNEMFIRIDNIPIRIYEDSTMKKVKYTIMSDSLFENYYSVFVIKKSSLMFLSNIKSCSSYNSPTINGWIEKKYCGVYICRNKQKLFRNPNEKSEYIILSFVYDKPVTVIDIFHGWYKISFIKSGVNYVGWVNDYCPNIYNSCT